MSEENHTMETEDSSEGQETLKYVLPPKKYKLKTLLLFSDFFAFFVYVYYLMIRSIINDVSEGSFSFVSNRMFSFYCVLAITVALLVLILIFVMKRIESSMQLTRLLKFVKKPEYLHTYHGSVEGLGWRWYSRDAKHSFSS